jgi:hypothetical protein
MGSHNSLFLRKHPGRCYVFGPTRKQRLQEPLKQECRRDLDLNQALSSPPFLDMINFSPLEVGQQLGANIVSHGKLEMVQ